MRDPLDELLLLGDPLDSSKDGVSCDSIEDELALRLLGCGERLGLDVRFEDNEEDGDEVIPLYSVPSSVSELVGRGDGVLEVGTLFRTSSDAPSVLNSGNGGEAADSNLGISSERPECSEVWLWPSESWPSEFPVGNSGLRSLSLGSSKPSSPSLEPLAVW